jgi:hypothetical protein
MNPCPPGNGWTRTNVHPEIGKFGRDQGVGENLTAGIWLIFRGLNFSRNADIGQIGHLWMGTNYGKDGNEIVYAITAGTNARRS